MVKHIIIWKLKEELTAEEKKKVMADAKAWLEGLNGKIKGLVSINVHTRNLPTSNGDMLLDSSFVDEAALKLYATHPLHLAVADGVIRPNTASRSCVDYII